jgi:hypothetical protein
MLVDMLAAKKATSKIDLCALKDPTIVDCNCYTFFGVCRCRQIHTAHKLAVDGNIEWEQ